MCEVSNLKITLQVHNLGKLKIYLNHFTHRKEDIMDKIILANKTEFEIADGASLSSIKIQAENFDAIKTITDAFTEANLKEVTFTHNAAESGKYADMKSDGFTYMPNVGEDGAEDGTYTVTVSLRTKTEMEKAIDELKAGHEANAEAIEELASITAGSEV